MLDLEGRGTVEGSWGTVEAEPQGVLGNLVASPLGVSAVSRGGGQSKWSLVDLRCSVWPGSACWGGGAMFPESQGKRGSVLLYIFVSLESGTAPGI